jgi:putative acetyltransferase
LSKNAYHIREIILSDNFKIAQVIRTVLTELGVPKVGIAHEDAAVDKMFESYNMQKTTYFVIGRGTAILGGAGISPLQNSKDTICKLQKMYFLPEARGKQLGFKMINTCLEAAKEFGFEKCYLEIVPYIKGAEKLYTKVGFKTLNNPIGNTGHHRCTLWILKRL